MNPNALKISPVVTNHEIEQFLALKETYQGLKKRIDFIEESMKAAEISLIEKVDSGADTSNCGFLLIIKEVSKRFPCWKEAFISTCGKQAADQVTEATPAKLYRNLVIQDR